MGKEPATSRRDFLRGRAAVGAIVDALDRAAPRSAAHCRATRRAMACEFVVQYHAGDGAEALEACLAALDLVEALEEQLSVYRESSEISQLNRTAAERPVAVEPRLWELLLSCERLHELTQGAFDLTSGPLSKAWGFWRREGRLPKAEEIAAALPLVSQKLVLLDHAKQGVSFANAGVEINFNAVGKGYALDRAAEVLVARGVGDFLIHGGRSSVLARGGDRSGGDGWRIAVPHPLSAERSLGEITLRDEALGTTGAGVQFFEVQGKRFGHVIDPRTGWPAEGVLLSTVVAPTAAEADALSTALYVLGPGGAAELCAEQPSIAAVLVCPRAGGGEEVDVHAFNLDAARWAPAAL